MKQLLTAPEAALALGCALGTLYNQRSLGILPLKNACRVRNADGRPAYLLFERQQVESLIIQQCGSVRDAIRRVDAALRLLGTESPLPNIRGRIRQQRELLPLIDALDVIRPREGGGACPS